MVKRTLLLAAALLVLGAASAYACDRPNGPFAGTVHATATISYVGGATKSWTWDRGVINALSSSSITLTRKDGARPTFAIDANTVVRNDGATYSLADLRLGQVATVITQNGATAAFIRRIRGVDEPSGNDVSAVDGPLKASLTGTVIATFVNGNQSSFQYDRGTVTALADGSLTVTRQDNSTVTLTFDSSLVVRNHGHVVRDRVLGVGDSGLFFSQNGKLALAHLFGRQHQGGRCGCGSHDSLRADLRHMQRQVHRLMHDR